MEISWNKSWPDDKKAYYDARKKSQTKGKAKMEADKADNAGVKQEATKAQKIAALKKQLEDLEK